MHNRISLARTLGLAVLLMGIMILQGCSSESSSSSSDANADFPYLTGQPAASPSTAVDGDTVSYTVLATGPLGLRRVHVYLTTFATVPGIPAQAQVDLTETSTDTWTGTATIDAAVPHLTGGDGYYVLIQLVVDPTNVDQTTTIYTRADQGERYTYSNLDSAFVEAGTGSSAYNLARVTMQ